MKMKILTAALFIAVFGIGIFAQGGKAEPTRISFAKGKSSATKTGSLKTGEEYEYIFGAKAGQKVKVKIVSTAPKGTFHYFTLTGSDFDFSTEEDKNYIYEFIAPENGDYLLTVYFNEIRKVRSGRFALTLTITN